MHSRSAKSLPSICATPYFPTLMLAEKVEAPVVSAAAHHSKFFRQSGWLMVANVAAGVMMWGVHFLSKRITAVEYGTLVTLLTAAILVPTMPLQMVFAQQTASDLALGRARQLAGKIRLLWLITFVLWLLVAAVMLSAQNWILSRWQIANPAALWALLMVILGSLWLPMFLGLLQGEQEFLWFGWATILNGVGRIGAAVLIVLALGGQAAGIMTGAAIGYGLAVAVGIWQTRRLWAVASEPFDWRSLLRQVVPLSLGFGATQFLFSVDTVFVKTWFPGTTAFYGAAGTLSRAIIWLVAPLVAVMFPKIVHAVAKSEKSDLMGLVLLGTAALAACGALGLWVFGPLVVRIGFLPSYVAPTTALLPWYAGAMVPLSLANVLVNNLLARSDFRIVPWLVILAAAYGIALTQFHATLVNVLQTLTVFCTLAFGICAWFTFHHSRSAARATLQSE